MQTNETTPDQISQPSNPQPTNSPPTTQTPPPPQPTPKKKFLIAMIVFLSIIELIGILIFLFGLINFGVTEARILLTALTIGGYSLTGLCCLVLYQERRFSPLAISGMIISIIGSVYTSIAIWDSIELNHRTWTLIITLIALAVTAAYSCLLLSLLPRVKSKSLRAIIIFISIVALMLIMFVLFAVYMFLISGMMMAGK